MNPLETRVDLEIRRHAVGNAITCSVTGAVLDVRTAVLVETNGKTMGVLSPEGWRQRRDAFSIAAEKGLVPNLSVRNAPSDAPWPAS